MYSMIFTDTKVGQTSSSPDPPFAFVKMDFIVIFFQLSGTFSSHHAFSMRTDRSLTIT